MKRPTLHRLLAQERDATDEMESIRLHLFFSAEFLRCLLLVFRLIKNARGLKEHHGQLVVIGVPPIAYESSGARLSRITFLHILTESQTVPVVIYQLELTHSVALRFERLREQDSSLRIFCR